MSCFTNMMNVEAKKPTMKENHSQYEDLQERVSHEVTHNTKEKI